MTGRDVGAQHCEFVVEIVGAGGEGLVVGLDGGGEGAFAEEAICVGF